jgi:hypothetical protein
MKINRVLFGSFYGDIEILLLDEYVENPPVLQVGKLM